MCCGTDERVIGHRLTRQSISSVALILRLAGSLDNIKASNFVIKTIFFWSSVTYVEINATVKRKCWKNQTCEDYYNKDSKDTILQFICHT